MTDLVREYASALFDLACEEGVVDIVLADVSCVENALAESPAYLDILVMPHIDIADKKKTLTRTFGDAHPYFLNFLCLLTERGYARHIPACLSAYKDLYRAANSIKCAVAESAVPLTEEEKGSLVDTLSRRYACSIELIVKINPALLGGVRVSIDGQLLDGTVRHRLDGIAARLASTVL